MQTLIGTPDRESWQETMPVWAHMRWRILRSQDAAYNAFAIDGFLFAYPLEDAGYILVKSPEDEEFAILVEKR